MTKSKSLLNRAIIIISVILLILLFILYPLVPIKTCQGILGEIEYGCHINTISIVDFIFKK